MRKKRFYLGRVEEHFGEFEMDTKFVFATTAPKTFARNLSRQWRDVGKPDDDGHYWFDGYCHDEVEYDEIPEADYLVLKKYLTDLS